MLQLRGRSRSDFRRPSRVHRAAERRGALEASGFASLLIHSGSPPMVFQDDQPYPFKVNAPFKLWAPLTDVADCFIYFEPGRRPLLLFHRPRTTGISRRTCRTATGPAIRSARRSRTAAAARPLLPDDLSRAAYLGEGFPELAPVGRGRHQPANRSCPGWTIERAAKTPYELVVPARGEPARGARASGRGRGLSDGASEFEIELAFLRGVRAARAGAAVQPDHRAQRGRGGAALPGAGAQRAARAAFAAHRCGCGVRGLRERHHAHVFAFEYGLRGARQRDGRAAAVAVRERARRAWTGATCTCPRIGWWPSCCTMRTSSRAMPMRPWRPACPACSCRTGWGICWAAGARRRRVHAVARRRGDSAAGRASVSAAHARARRELRRDDGAGALLHRSAARAGARRSPRRAHQLVRVEHFRPFGGIRIEDNLAITATGCENLTRDAFAASSTARSSAARLRERLSAFGEQVADLA